MIAIILKKGPESSKSCNVKYGWHWLPSSYSWHKQFLVQFHLVNTYGFAFGAYFPQYAFPWRLQWTADDIFEKYLFNI